MQISCHQNHEAEMQAVWEEDYLIPTPFEFLPVCCRNRKAETRAAQLSIWICARFWLFVVVTTRLSCVLHGYRFGFPWIMTFCFRIPPGWNLGCTGRRLYILLNLFWILLVCCRHEAEVTAMKEKKKKQLERCASCALKSSIVDIGSRLLLWRESRATMCLHSAPSLHIVRASIGRGIHMQCLDDYAPNVSGRLWGLTPTIPVLPARMNTNRSPSPRYACALLLWLNA